MNDDINQLIRDRKQEFIMRLYTEQARIGVEPKLVVMDGEVYVLHPDLEPIRLSQK